MLGFNYICGLWFKLVLSEYLTFTWAHVWTFSVFCSNTMLLKSDLLSLGPILSTLLLKLTLLKPQTLCPWLRQLQPSLKSATCLSSDSPAIVECLLTFNRTQGPFLYRQVFVWVKSPLRNLRMGFRVYSHLHGL